MFIVAGASALSAFKQRQLLTRLSAVAAISAIDTQFVYLFDEPLSDKALPVALGLLNDGASFELRGAQAGQVQVLVTPRIGTISPWSSKAQDIFKNCGQPIGRLERGIVYTLSGLDAVTPQIVAELHDRMTESTFLSVDAAAALFSHACRWMKLSI